MMTSEGEFRFINTMDLENAIDGEARVVLSWTRFTCDNARLTLPDGSVAQVVVSDSEPAGRGMSEWPAAATVARYRRLADTHQNNYVWLDELGDRHAD